MGRRDMDAVDLVGAEKLRRIDQVMEITGIALVQIGLTALLMGYIGVANEGLVFLQLPYLVSGGLLGLGLLFAAGTIYLASWISRSSAAARRQNAELIDEVRALSDRLALLAMGGTGANGSSNGSGRRFVATPGGTMFHRPDCSVVSSRDDLHEVSADAPDMSACGMCDPLAADVQAPSSN